MTRDDLLKKAAEIVNGDRDKEYGGPEDCFRKISLYWMAYLGRRIEPEDVAIMMMFVKIARLEMSEFQSADSWVDIAGYAACGAEIAQGEEDGGEED